MKIVIASRNKGKIEEIKQIISVPGVEWLTFEDFEDWPEMEEKGEDYEENALLKAQDVSDMCALPAIADDSGLEVHYLGGKPGVHSARYAGEECDDKKNIEKLLGELDGVGEEDRGARFVCVAAMVFPGQDPLTVRGECAGQIIHSPRGNRGFGYDPVFMPEGYDLTMAELGLGLKNRISHRGRAFTKIKEALMSGLRSLG